MACNPDCSASCCNAVAVVDEPAHWVAPSEDCMGESVPGYWRQFLKCSDGFYVLGNGKYKEEAEANALKAKEAREAEINLPPRERLKLFLGKELCDKEMKEAIQCLIQLALQYPV